MLGGVDAPRGIGSALRSGLLAGVGRPSVITVRAGIATDESPPMRGLRVRRCIMHQDRKIVKNERGTSCLYRVKTLPQRLPHGGEGGQAKTNHYRLGRPRAVAMNEIRSCRPKAKEVRSDRCLCADSPSASVGGRGAARTGAKSGVAERNSAGWRRGCHRLQTAPRRFSRDFDGVPRVCASQSEKPLSGANQS
jgi:hypothetical protein